MRPNDWFSEIFKQMVEQMQHEVDGIDELFESVEKGNNKTVTRSWGVRIRRSPDGGVIVERFGDTPMMQELKGGMQPLIDIIQEGDEYIVVADVPGVEEDRIAVELREGEAKKILIISSLDEQRKYYKELDIPSNVASDFKKSYRNGVLEIRFKVLKET